MRGCLNKIPKLRPTYAMLIRHAWLAPLMKPPTISEDETEDSTEARFDSDGLPLPETADKEVANWVKAAIQRKLSGKMAKSEKPALHAAPLDAIPSSPLLHTAEVGPTDASSAATAAVTATTAGKVPEPNIPVVVGSHALEAERVASLDFAGGVEPT